MNKECCLVFKVGEGQFEEVRESFCYETIGSDGLNREKFSFCNYVAFVSPRLKVLVAAVEELSCRLTSDGEMYRFSFSKICDSLGSDFLGSVSWNSVNYLVDSYYMRSVVALDYSVRRPDFIPERLDLERAACAVANKYGVGRDQVSIVISSKIK